MVQIYPVQIGEKIAIAITVALPKTNLLVVTTDIGYIMCGALDIKLLNEKLADRKIISGRATGVKTIDQLLAAPLESVTYEAEQIGIYSGTIGRDAIKIMLNQESV